MPKRSWTEEQLVRAVQDSKSYRSVLIKLGLKPIGGNYQTIQYAIRKMAISTEHFTGKGWNVGGLFRPIVPPPVASLLFKGSLVQSHKLKNRLFKEGIFKPICQLCGWAELSVDGRVPVELDHINGDHTDNRIENLRILCPNCHSLQITHRGVNKGKRYARVVERYTQDT